MDSSFPARRQHRFGCDARGRFETGAEGGHRPGTTGEIGMTCPVAVREGQRFEAFERKRPVGSGVVLPRAPG